MTELPPYDCKKCGHQHTAEEDEHDGNRFRWCDAPTCSEPGCCACPCFEPPSGIVV